MRRLIQRYLLASENSKKPCQSDAPQLTAERLGNSSELKDVITQLQGILRRSEESKCPADAANPQLEVTVNRETKIFLCAIRRTLHYNRTATGTSVMKHKTY